MWRYKAKSISDGLAYEAQQRAAKQTPPPQAIVAPVPASVPTPVTTPVQVQQQIKTVTVYKTVPKPDPETKALKDSITALQKQNTLLLQQQQKAEQDRLLQVAKAEQDRIAQMAKIEETKQNIENKLTELLANQQQQKSSQQAEEKLSSENQQLQLLVDELKLRLEEATNNISTHSALMNEGAASTLISPSHSKESDRDSLVLLFSKPPSIDKPGASPDIGSDYVKVGEPTPVPTPVSSPRATPKKEGLT